MCHQILYLPYYLFVFLFFYPKSKIGIVLTKFSLPSVQLLIYLVQGADCREKSWLKRFGLFESD